jgi:hypothetical protein
VAGKLFIEYFVDLVEEHEEGRPGVFVLEFPHVYLVTVGNEDYV